MPTEHDTRHAFIDEAIRRASEGDLRLEGLLQIAYGRILHRTVARDETLAMEERDLHHVRDWLKAAIVSDVAWLSNVDEAGRPRKLLKLGSIDACLREADKAMHRANEKLTGTVLGPKDEATEFGLADGYSVVRLLSEKALDLESVRMGHCIGNGAYDHDAGRPDIALLSLRDSRGRPHATLRVARHRDRPDNDDDVETPALPTVMEISGKGNARIHLRHARRIVPFLDAYGLDLRDAARLGFVRAEDGSWISCRDLKPGMQVRGNVRIDDDTTLPDDLLVDGTVDFVGSDVWIPSGLVSTGRIRISHHRPMEELPSGLSAPILHVLKTRVARIDGRTLDCAVVHYEPNGLTDCDFVVSSRQSRVKVSNSERVTFEPGVRLENLHVSAVETFAPRDDTVVTEHLHLEGVRLRELPPGMLATKELVLAHVGGISLDRSMALDMLSIVDSEVTLQDGLSSRSLVAERSTLDALPGTVFEVLKLLSTTVRGMPSDLDIRSLLEIVRVASADRLERIQGTCRVILADNGLTKLPALDVTGDVTISEPEAGSFRTTSTIHGRVTLYSPSRSFDLSSVRTTKDVRVERTMPLDVSARHPVAVPPGGGLGDGRLPASNASPRTPEWNRASVRGVARAVDGELVYLGFCDPAPVREVAGLAIHHAYDIPDALVIGGNLLITGEEPPLICNRFWKAATTEVRGDVMVKGRGASNSFDTFPRFGRRTTLARRTLGNMFRTHARDDAYAPRILVHGNLDIRNAVEVDLSLFEVRGRILRPPILRRLASRLRRRPWGNPWASPEAARIADHLYRGIGRYAADVHAPPEQVLTRRRDEETAQ